MRTHYGKTDALNVCRIAAAMFTTIASPYSSERLKALSKGEFGSKMPNPAEYVDASSFAYDYACHTYLKKLKVASDVARLTDEAIDRFKAVEHNVMITNRNLRYRPIRGEGLLSVARRQIACILGRFDFHEWFAASGWGPGATSTLTSTVATVDRKILEPELSVTARTVKWANLLLQVSPVWTSARIGRPIDGPTSLIRPFNIVKASRFTTVDKDYKTRRAIDIQPTMNLFLQKGVGKMIRRRLQRIGIDLDDQSRNQELARAAYHSGLATIDLANASDSLSSELVRILLPPKWFEILDDLRTEFTEINGEVHYLHKFSAMGNGYTFELESLIFYALAKAVSISRDSFAPIGVYGDDIVVHKDLSEDVIDILEQVGFATNRDKTFLSGNFYESCGKHFFKGLEVTPLYQKEEITDPTSAIRAANRLYRWAERIAWGFGLDDVAYHPWSVAVSIAAREHRLWCERIARSKSRKRGEPRYKPLPTQPYHVEGDRGLLGISECCRSFGWVFVPTKIPGDQYALLSEDLRTREGRTSSEGLPTLGLVTLRGRGRYMWNRQVYPVHPQPGPSWLRLRLEL